MSAGAISSSGHTGDLAPRVVHDPLPHDQLTPLPTKPLPLGDVVMTDKIRSTRSRTVNRKMINQYEFDQRVGKGQHGDVYLARDTSQHGMFVAIKAIKRKNPKVDKMSLLRKRNIPASPSHVPLTDNLGSTEHKIRKEIAIMKKCCHPHVVRLLEVIDDKLNERIYMGTSICCPSLLPLLCSIFVLLCTSWRGACSGSTTRLATPL
ncbi:hypothetical protein B0H21DRAFT_42838 [Amylocystis lapponica]|nr:hypothetical protein B0H21DRAFT_42838 [Amylocystis lapponica]